MKVTMIGKGAWGSAIASLLGRNEHEVAFLQRDDKTWPNEDPGEMVFLAIPCQNLRQRLESLPDPKLPVVSLIKGIEIDRFLRVTEIIRSVWSNAAVATISGPSFASEVIENAPTAAVVASDDEALAIRIQDAVHQKLFRLYRSTDLVGVELGGALKNVYALAGGMCSGLGIGENGMAALMTRSLAEMSRIAGSLGARQETLFGLSGIGDLMLTAYSGESRNHRVGEAVGRGESLKNVLENLKGTAEGVPTTHAVYQWVKQHEIKAPIVDELHSVFYEEKSPRDAFENLILRKVSLE